MHDNTIYNKLVLKDFRKKLKVGDKVKVSHYSWEDFASFYRVKDLKARGWDVSIHIREVSEICKKKDGFISIRFKRLSKDAGSCTPWSPLYSVYPIEFTEKEILYLDPNARGLYSYLGLI